MTSCETTIFDSGVPALGKAVRVRFPIFTAGNRQGRPLSYLDSGASAQKADVVIERQARYLTCEHANIHRGAYALSAEATQNFERTREVVRSFISAPTVQGVIFTRGTTEALNLVAYSLEEHFAASDSILLTVLEHHSNIVPWQLLAKRRGLKLEYVDCDDNAVISLTDFERALQTVRPKLVSLTHVANSFGSVLPVANICELAKSYGALVSVDVAQSIAHAPIDMQAWGADFVSFSGHKIYGPTGVGVLACSERALELMQPFQGGGDMISTVALEGSTWAEAPHKFEAGTPAIAEVIALASALEFVRAVGLEKIAQYEAGLFQEAFELLKGEAGVTVYGPAVGGGEQASIVSFNVAGVHPHDLASVADSFNVQIRAGHHCAMPALKRMGIPSSARASLAMYNCLDDFHALVAAIRQARKMFA